MDGTHSPLDRDLAQNESTTPFPSTSFNFSLPPYFDIPITASTALLAEPTQYPSNLRPNLENSRYDFTRSSSSNSYPTPPSTGEGLFTAAASATAAMAEEYAYGANVEGADQTPIFCTNCQTTNTSLWRRDSEGQTLCEIMCT